MRFMAGHLLALFIVAVFPISAPATVLLSGYSYDNHDLVDGNDAVLDDDSLTSPRYWDGGPGAVVTYSFAEQSYPSSGLDFTGVTEIVPLFSFMPAGFRTAIEAAFDAWSAIADIIFQEVDDSGTAFNAYVATGDIRIGGHGFDGSGGTLAHTFYPPPNGASAAGDMHFDKDENWVIGFDGPGHDIFQVAVHEIGHAIGLSHSNVPHSIMNPHYTEAFRGPQITDMARIQSLYGEPILVSVTAPRAGILLLLSLTGILVMTVVRSSTAENTAAGAAL